MTLSNNPLLDADLIPDSLATRYPELVKRLAELKAGFERFPATVDDPETAEKSVLFEKMMGAFITEAEKAHETEKAPYLASGRAVDTFFLANMKKIVEPWKKTVNQRRVAFQDKVAREERERVAAEAKRAQEEAARLEATMQTDADLEKAITVTEQAMGAVEAVQNFKASEVGRIKSEMGVTASLSYEWVGEIQDPSQLDIAKLLPFIPVDVFQKALTNWIKINKSGWADHQVVEFKGAKIWMKPKGVVR